MVFVRPLIKFFIAIFILMFVAVATLWLRAFKPLPEQLASVYCDGPQSSWVSSTPLKVMSFNVQYMASKNYVFFYDIDTNDSARIEAVLDSGRTVASYPSEEDVTWTLDQVAQLITAEDPDVVMLQEVNGSEDSRTHYIDQVAELLNRLPDDVYPCRSEASYWRAEFVLHPRILGPVNMELVTLSKYAISQSIRHQLPRPERSFLTKPFNFQRALLESHLTDVQGNSIALINTHFEAWGAGTEIMKKQVSATKQVLRDLEGEGIPWILGGDFNLLPPDGNRQRSRITKASMGNYDEVTAIGPMYDEYRGIPALEELQGHTPERWYTYFPNDPYASGPDRTIDYLFFSDAWKLSNSYVVQEGALEISDHLPVVGVFRRKPD
jgi:endonuclease/exonuclease/phosphatase family metal-dependent hydrolase